MDRRRSDAVGADWACPDRDQTVTILFHPDTWFNKEIPRTEIMPLTWLPEDDTHPVRPDVPVARHLTFTEVHALELGIYIGLFAFFALQLGYGEAIVTLFISIIRFTMSDGKAKAGGTRATHRMGFHDVRQEPPYFGAGVLMALAVAVVGSRLYRLLDIGPPV